MKYCPFCDKQGIINKAQIKNTTIEIFICDECDTVWKTSEISKKNCESFEQFMMYNNIVYFYNSYLIMKDYGDEIANILKTFKDKEGNQKLNNLFNEIENLISLPSSQKSLIIHKILNLCADLDITEKEFLQECNFLLKKKKLFIFS